MPGDVLVELVAQHRIRRPLRRAPQRGRGRARHRHARPTAAHAAGDNVLGEVAHLNGHYTAEVQKDGAYRTDLAHRLRVRRHKRERRRTRRRERHHQRRGRFVVVTVDGNFDGLQLPPLTSCWDGRKAVGTLGGRTVDIVFADRPARRVETFAICFSLRALPDLLAAVHATAIRRLVIREYQVHADHMSLTFDREQPVNELSMALS